MSGAVEAGDMETRVLTALMSGCDFALICQSSVETDKAIDALLQNRELWKQPGWQLDHLRPEDRQKSDEIEQIREYFFELIS